MENLIEKFNFVSTPWKIIIPIANHQEESMKYQALRPHFFSIVGWGDRVGWWAGWRGRG